MDSALVLTRQSKLSGAARQVEIVVGSWQLTAEITAAHSIDSRYLTANALFADHSIYSRYLAANASFADRSIYSRYLTANASFADLSIYSRYLTAYAYKASLCLLDWRPLDNFF